MSQTRQSGDGAARGRKRSFARVGILALGAIALLAAHGIVLGYLSAHPAVPAVVVAGVIVVAIAKHLGLKPLGLMGALAARFRRRRH